MRDALLCPKCQGSMQVGLILDYTSAAATTASKWMEGLPERGFLFGLRTRGRQQHPIKSFRCNSCGYLEAYAKSD